MTYKEAIYLLRNTAWLAPSLEPIDEAIEMACDALDKVEYINSQLGKVDDEPTISKMEQVDKDINVRSKDEPQTLKCFKADKYKSCEYVGKCDNHICLKALSEGEKRAKAEPQTERESE